MVIGNLTQAEESAIHGERNPKGGTGDSDRQSGREDAHMVRVLLPGLPLGSEAGKKGEEENGPFGEVLTQLNCRIFPPHSLKNLKTLKYS